VTIRRATGRFAATASTASKSCGPRSGLHSTVQLSFAGDHRLERGLHPSIDTILMSTPGVRPASSIASIAPIAMSSLCA
jgi:hypothetical protein